MKIKLFKDNQEIVFGIRYSKHFMVNGEHMLTISFWKWDLQIEW